MPSAQDHHSSPFDLFRSGLLGAVGGAVSGVGGFVGTVVTNVVGGVLEGARPGKTHGKTHGKTQKETDETDENGQPHSCCIRVSVSLQNSSLAITPLHQCGKRAASLWHA